jgi:uncharacterized membrane protein YhaH (DUF805 family)
MQLPKEYFGFSGRLGRLQWWQAQGSILLLIGLAIGSQIFFTSLKAEPSPGASTQTMFVFGFTFLLAVVVNVCSTVKRYHDRGKSGAWFFFAFVPIIGGLWQFIECGFCSGDEGDNEYGPPFGNEPSGLNPPSLKQSRSVDMNPSASFAKLDDNYIENYAKKFALERALQQAEPTQPSFGSGAARPVFGKR